MKIEEIVTPAVSQLLIQSTNGTSNNGDRDPEKGIATLAGILFVLFALIAGGFIIHAVASCARRRTLAHENRRENISPFANRIQHALNLGISDFEEGEGLKFVQIINMLIGKLFNHNTVYISQELSQKLSDLAAMVIRQHTTIRAKGCRMFRSYAIDCEELRSKVDVIAQDVANAWRRTTPDSVPIPLQYFATAPVTGASTTTVTPIP